MSGQSQGKRLRRDQIEAIVADVRRGKVTYQAISRKHNVSLSTVHRHAEEAGLTKRRKRTAPIEAVEETYDSDNRKAALDMLMDSIRAEVRKGGQSSKQLLDLSRAAREVSTARANEDKLSDGYAEAHAGGPGGAGGAIDAVDLVGLTEDDIPKNLEVYNGVLDIVTARDDGNLEEAKELEGRVKEACLRAGAAPFSIDIERMQARIDADWPGVLSRARMRYHKEMAEKGMEYNGEEVVHLSVSGKTKEERLKEIEETGGGPTPPGYGLDIS